jgi:uncharacterized membrane protein HdeD (DUF308 family)
MSDKTNRGWLILSSLAGIVVGVVALLWTGMSALALVYVIGAYAITLGIISLGGAFWLPLPNDGRLVLSLIGLASILVGIAMIAEPGAGALALLALIAAFALTNGSFELVAAVGGERLLKRRARAFMEAHEPQTGATATPSPSH